MLAKHLATPLGGACILASVLSASPALAASVGFEIRIGGGPNAPIVHVLNQSSAASISGFDITIGDTSLNFDKYTLKNLTNVTFTSSSIDDIDGGLRSDVLSFDFSDFGPGKQFRVKTDIDSDDEESKENFNETFFNLSGEGESDRPVVTVDFSDGTQLSDLLPVYDSKPDGAYIFAINRQLPGSDPTPVIPLPPGLWAGLSLLGGLGVLGLAKKTLRRH